MASVTDLNVCARTHFARYTDPDSRRAFRTYDWQGDPAKLTPVDLLAPALLDAPLKGSHIVAMYRTDGEYRRIRESIEVILADTRCATARFEDVDLQDSDGPWAVVMAAFYACDHTWGIKATKVSKILHRKRPDLVPIFDRLVAEFYGVSPSDPLSFWPRLQQDVRQHHGWLDELASGCRTPDGRRPSTLRVLDIVVWEHQQSDCNV